VVEVQVLRVFTDEAGRFGNPLGVVTDARGLTDASRQEIATHLGYSETVFVEDIDQARLRIFTPATELRLAGHPLVGTAWLLGQLTGAAVPKLRPVLAGEVDTWAEADVIWIRAATADSPPWELAELPSPAEVEALPQPPLSDNDQHEFWAWLDRDAGIVRARFFGGAYGVPEDEATGSAALLLAAHLGRAITIRQGQGSVLYARPSGAGRAEVGGRVASDGVRRLD
jgi:predicted PhzF superfamily epimerase YddE/YHI9